MSGPNRPRVFRWYDQWAVEFPHDAGYYSVTTRLPLYDSWEFAMHQALAYWQVWFPQTERARRARDMGLMR